VQRIHVHVIAQPSRAGVPGVTWMDEILDGIDGYPVDRLSTGDVVGNHLECFTALGYMAARTSRVHIGPFVTTAATRDVGLLAAAALSLDAVSRGRAYMILGRGDGIVRNLGLRPQTVEEAREAITSLRALLHSDQATHAGRAITLRWPGRDRVSVPVYTAPGGPRMLEMSAATCDGVYLATGCTKADVQHALAVIDAAPRDAPLDVWWVTRFGIGDTMQEALDAVSEGLASIGNHALRGDPAARGVPRELWGALREYHERFSYERKNPLPGRRADGPTNVELMNELGLRDYFLDRFGIAGTPDRIVDRLLELERRGVHSVTLLAQSRRELDLIGTHVLPRLAELSGTGQPPPAPRE